MNKGRFPMRAGNIRLDIDVKTLPNVACKAKVKGTLQECGSVYFLPVVELRVANALLTGESRDTIVPIQAFRCVSCGQVVTITDPDPAIEGRNRPTS